MQRRRVVANTALLAAVSIAVVLLRYPPRPGSFYPACPIFSFTQLQCPGCGTTRALAELLRGNFTQALHWNALSVVLLPLAIAYGGVCYIRTLRNTAFAWPRIANSAVYAALIAATLFTLARNLL